MNHSRVSRVAAMVAVLAVAASVPAWASDGRGQSGDGLQPGEFVTFKQRVPVDVVLIGFDSAGVQADEILARLPKQYAPLVRYPQFYGLNGADLGLEFTFGYRVRRVNAAFRTRFFDYLTRIGTAGPLTTYQARYNAQARNVLDVTGPVLYIDAPLVERWLATNDTDAPSKGYTIYFINWYGHPGFSFHVYTKTDDPDPDTGFNFGRRAQGAMHAWGGTSSRSWFYDFSAGPEWNTTNWVVDVRDLDGDQVEDYRMPVIWEYAANGYRAPDRLSQDMGLLARFVGINLLFTTSPLFDPMVAAPDALGQRVADTTVFDDDPATTGATFYNPAFARDMWRAFQPYYLWQSPTRSVSPIDAGAKRSLGIFTGTNVVNECWVPFGTTFAQLFCYFDQTKGTYLPSYGSRHYVAPVFAFNTTAAGMGSQSGLLGFADDNWVDGTQSYVFAFDTDAYRSAGFGFTATIVHEVGHHIGMSHPHDGYDAEAGLDYSPAGTFYFAWSGGESDTVMHYMGLTNKFGVHNKDNMHRWEFASYMNWANALAGDIQGSSQGSASRFGVRIADAYAKNARRAFERWNYLEAVESARKAFITLKLIADAIGCSKARFTSAGTPLPNATPYRHADRPRLLQERLLELAQPQ